ncbi:Nucleotidyltransferase domain containing protein, expressed [Zostera marina]|uniref:Nucleotidyltransferase domain containing protein, expressed n=1 Tax=Zostera marina TaxID=29655 RepID=A0A0K9PPA2_ZOSMR|nr:Nucleotidyltransferase domain containing protein, expressed [Zostera marina]
MLDHSPRKDDLVHNIMIHQVGSGPLMTYLKSDGDIDLTVVTPSGKKIVNDVLLVLESEKEKGRNTQARSSADLVINDVQHIPAEVQLIKCMIQGTMIDISFEQLGGLKTLEFLQKADELIGREHLFKRSVLLLKGWCFYESRILGSAHGLISTYGLQIMVLFIFNLFNSSIKGPFSVMHLFLNYYDKFDWDNFGITLQGPFKIASLPNIALEKIPGDENEQVLFSDGFLQQYREGHDVINPAVRRNALYVIDPLRKNNNLCRGVNRGTLMRIRSALRFGSTTLNKILKTSTTTRLEAELEDFFKNTIQTMTKTASSVDS